MESIHVTKKLIDSLDMTLNKVLPRMKHKEFFSITQNRDNHYVDHIIQEKKGNGRVKTRVISEPSKSLKRIQRAFLDYLQEPIRFPTYIQAYTEGRTTTDIAKALVPHEVIMHLDVNDFFGSITSAQVKRALGCVYGFNPDGTLAHYIAKLGTRRKRRFITKGYAEEDFLLEYGASPDFVVEKIPKWKASRIIRVLSGNVQTPLSNKVKTYNFEDVNKDLEQLSPCKLYELIDKTELPQGGSLSSLLANLVGYVYIDQLILSYLDSIESELEDQNIESLKYFRYSDDILIGVKLKNYKPGSKDQQEKEEAKRILNQANSYAKGLMNYITKLVANETPFSLKESKAYTMIHTQKQRVFGVNVNVKPNLNRRAFLHLKNMLFTTAMDGLVAGARRNKFNSPAKFFQHLTGRLNYVKSINPHKYNLLVNDYLTIKETVKKMDKTQLENIGLDYSYIESMDKLLEKKQLMKEKDITPYDGGKDFHFDEGQEFLENIIEDIKKN